MGLRDLTGMVFGRLTVISRGPNIENKAAWNCFCECGNSKLVRSWLLISKNTSSCGCLQKESKGKSSITHGRSNTSEYKCWLKIKERCTKPTDISYKNYGGRGIKICDRWLSSFENFLADVGLKPGKKYSIERINANGDYEPCNCKWASRDEQARNKRNNIRIEFQGRIEVLKDWSKIIGFAQSSYFRRKNKTNSSPSEIIAYYANKGKSKREVQNSL